MSIMSFWKKRDTARSLTGVKSILSAAHRDQRTGQVHGHTWEIVAWFKYRGVDQSAHKRTLETIVKRYDHTCLPDKMAWGEAMAKQIWLEVNADHSWYDGAYSWDCIAVDVSRPSEGIYARFEA